LPRPEGGEAPAPPPSAELPAASAQPVAESPDSVRRSKRYQRRRMALAAMEWAVEVALLAVLLVSGLSVGLREWATRRTDNPWLVVLLYLLPVGLLFGLVSVAFSAIRTFRLDRRFALSNETMASWLVDEIKSLALGGLLALAAIETLYGLLRYSPERWWVWAGGVFSLFFLLLAQLAPVLIFPLFFRFTRITDAEITGRLERLARQAGARIEGVYEMNLSRKTRAANAALVGFGRTRRIVLADNLLDNFTLDEIEAVLAHEFAHHAQHHLAKAILVQTVTFFVLFYGIHWVLDAAGNRFGFSGPADPANLPLLGLSATALGLLFLPATNGLLRRFERRADDYALQVATRPRAFASALQRLAQINLADRTPHPLVEWVFYSHPAIGTRIARAEKILNRNHPLRDNGASQGG
jgi:STE24 endopeptidase